MEIVLSEINIIPVKPQKGLIAFCSFVINDAFSVNDIGIHSRLDGSGYRLVYPMKTLRTGKEINIFYPINRKTAQVIEGQVTEAFELLIKKNGYEQWEA